MTTLAEWMCKADDGKPGESLGETSTEELKATLAKLKPTDPGAEQRIAALKAELKKRGGGDMDKGCGMKKATVEIEVNSEDENEDKKEMEKGELSPEKARQMLHERSGGHGRPITEQQRKFFGAIGGHLPAPGGKAKKSYGHKSGRLDGEGWSVHRPAGRQVGGPAAQDPVGCPRGSEWVWWRGPTQDGRAAVG